MQTAKTDTFSGKRAYSDDNLPQTSSAPRSPPMQTPKTDTLSGKRAPSDDLQQPSAAPRMSPMQTAKTDTLSIKRARSDDNLPQTSSAPLIPPMQTPKTDTLSGKRARSDDLQQPSAAPCMPPMQTSKTDTLSIKRARSDDLQLPSAAPRIMPAEKVANLTIQIPDRGAMQAKRPAASKSTETESFSPTAPCPGGYWNHAAPTTPEEYRDISKFSSLKEPWCRTPSLSPTWKSRTHVREREPSENLIPRSPRPSEDRECRGRLPLSGDA